jgi:prepilin-type N-terminal cleavage/methylation domain-containing protein
MHRLEPQLMKHTPLRQAGFTLTELLIGAFLTGVALTAVATVAIGHIRVTDRTMWTIQFRRDLSRLNSLLSAEAAEACRLADLETDRLRQRDGSKHERPEKMTQVDHG